MTILMQNLTFSYNKSTEKGVASVFNNFSCEFREGNISAVVGPSGCGKTTMLRLISGIENPTSKRSKILIDSIEPADAHKAGIISYLPQDFGPAPWKTASENIRFVLKLSQKDEENLKESADAFLKQVGLGEWGHRYPKQLSGGEARRLTLSMCLAVKPKYLLLDEPFTGLDVNTKNEIIDFIKRLWFEEKATEVTPGKNNQGLKGIILVSHDLDDVLFLADKVFVLPRIRPSSSLIPLQSSLWDSYHKKRTNKNTADISRQEDFGQTRSELHTLYAQAVNS